MQTSCIVSVVRTLSDTHRLTQHDLLAFSSPKTQTGAYRIPETRFTIRLIEHALSSVLARLCRTAIAEASLSATPLHEALTLYWIALCIQA